MNRNTKETQIEIEVWLDREGGSKINTGVGFFDHMLDQIATHGGLRMNVEVKGDLYIDDHHTVEDTGLALGEALLKALGDKRGIGRFGFVLPMDECGALRAGYFRPSARSSRRSLTTSAWAISAPRWSSTFPLALLFDGQHAASENQRQNDHHRVESLFKAFGRTLRRAIRVEGNTLPSSKGVL